MLQFSKTIDAAIANCGEAMETRDHLKNGASSKSQMSRGNFFNKICFVLLVAVIVLGSCSKENESIDEGINEGKGKVSKIDIKNASVLFIASSNSTLKSTMGQDRLFKITDGGLIEEVSYLDEFGNQIDETFIPETIYTIYNSDYFGVKMNDKFYLVRKSDGAIFVLNTVLGPVNNTARRTGGFLNSEYIVQNPDKSMYLKNILDQRIYKLDVSNPESITSTPLTPDTEYASFWAVSYQGDIFYYKGDYMWRVRKSNGGLYTVQYEDGFCWTGFDGKIKFVRNGNLCTVNVGENGDVTIDEQTFGFLFSGFYILRFNNRIIVGNGSSFCEVENESNTPKRVSWSYDINTFYKVVNTENYYYIFGRNSSQTTFIIKIDPTNDTVTELITGVDYDLYAMTVTNNDDVIFNALRMSDGVKVLGRISSTGNIQIIDEQMNYETIVLERIQ